MIQFLGDQYSMEVTGKLHMILQILKGHDFSFIHESANFTDHDRKLDE